LYHYHLGEIRAFLTKFSIHLFTTCRPQLDDPDLIKLPIPNDRVLPLVEMLQVHEVLSQAQDGLEALDLEITQAKAIYDVLLAKREKHTSRMERLQAMVAPQKGLPDEILAEIFVLAASGFAIAVPPRLTHYRDIGPWILTRVCSRWRLVALNEPRLWTRVQLSDLYNDNNPKLMPAAEEVLRRGGRSLVDLTVRGRASEKLFLSIIAPLLHHVGTLRLDVTALFMSDFPSLPPALCALEEIFVSPSKWLESPSSNCRIFQGAHKLCKFTLTGGYLASDVNFRFPWNQLMSLELQHVSFDHSTFHEVLSQCSGLVTLVANISTQDLDADDTPDTILLPRLESLELRVGSGGRAPSATSISSLCVPTLSRLSFGADSWGLDSDTLFDIAGVLHHSSSPLINLQIMVTCGAEEDMDQFSNSVPGSFSWMRPFLILISQLFRK